MYTFNLVYYFLLTNDTKTSDECKKNRNKIILQVRTLKLFLY